MSIHSLFGTLVLSTVLHLLVPALLSIGASLFWLRVRRWPAVLMMTGAFLALILALPSVAMHPLFPLFRRIPTQQFAQLSMWLNILSTTAWLTFAIGLTTLAVMQKKETTEHHNAAKKMLAHF